MHILLIEPDTVSAGIYARALTNDRHHVVTASSAQTAIHAADQRTPDLVLLELQLPSHNGIEFLYELRSYQEWFGVPVVLHTVVPESELANAVTLKKELGVRRILYKPSTNLRLLRDTVNIFQTADQ